MMPITLGATAVRELEGLFSLNDLHKASGGAEKHKPALFLRLEQTQELVNELAKGTDLYLFLKAVKGRNGGTYACRELVIAYAAWISAAFHLKVIRVFLAATTPQRTPYTVNPSDTLTGDQAETLRLMVKTLAERLPKEDQAAATIKVWSKLKAHFRVPYREIPQSEFTEAISIVTRTAAEWEIVEDHPLLSENYAKGVNSTHTPAAPDHRQYHDYPAPLTALPFVADIQVTPHQTRRSFWHVPHIDVPHVDNYGAACEIGRNYAAHFAQYIKDNPGWVGGNLLGHIASDIDFSDKSGAAGYWVGFFSHLEHLIHEGTRDMDVFADADRINAQYAEIIARRSPSPKPQLKRLRG